MTTTPTIWKAEFLVNATLTAGSQLRPATIGLADDRFITVWADDTSGTQPGNDLFAQFFDAQGNPVGVAFQLNSANFVDNEQQPAIAALADGGFVIAYNDLGTAAGGDNSIRFERYDSAGVRTAFGTIASGTIGGTSQSQPSIAVLANGDYVISYQEQLAGGDSNIFAKVVNGGTNVVGPALTAAQDSADDDRAPDTAVLTNGTIVTVYREIDSGVGSIESRGIDAAGSSQFLIANSFTESSSAHVAALTLGGFVTVWQDDVNNDIRADIHDNSGNIVTADFLITGNADSLNEPQVIGLKDGGFYVVWDNDTVGGLFGARFSATGSLLGSVSQIATGFNITEPELGLTDDGRILVTFDNDAAEISQIILDPRDNIINGDSTSETITSRIDGATVNGNNGNDVLLGQAAADSLFGGSGEDTLTGGGGNDTLQGGFSTDTVNGGAGNDLIQVLDGEFGDNTDGGVDTDVLDVSNLTNYSIVVDMQGGTYTLRDTALNTFGVVNTLVGVENVNGTQLGDIIRASDGTANVVNGNGGNDTIEGGLQVDTLNGGAGNDTIFANTAANIDGSGVGDTISGGIGNDTLTGSGGFDTLNGDDDVDTLSGRAGNDALNGGAGADSMDGGADDDTFIVDNAGDTIIEGAGGGTDTAFVTLSYTLGAAAEVETLRTTNGGGVGAINLTGNSFVQTIIGNAGVNQLYGAGGADTLQGLGGNDSYIVDNAGVVIIEGAGGGADTAFVTLSYALGAAAQVETLRTTNAGGLGAINLTGNGFVQSIIGNAGVNILDGGAGADNLSGLGGNDSYIVDNAGDTIVEGAGGGTDTVFATLTYALGAAAQVETLRTTNGAGLTAIDFTGNGFVQTLIGNAGANRLDGGAGADTLQGLGGNDTYIVDNAGDVIVEGAGGGSDTAFVGLSYALGAAAQVETLRTTNGGGVGAINLTGNDFVQTVIGNNGNNRIDGKGGADILSGLGGNDTFVFSSALNLGIDTINDFSVPSDTIELKQAIFAAAGALGTLGVDAFFASAAGVAHDASDRIIYDTDSGALFYDADGNAGGAAVQFATLTTGLALTNADFVVA